MTDADWFDVRLTWQIDDVPALKHAPPHPEICHPLAGEAVSVTVVPFANDPLSLVPFVGIEIPVGVDVTVPDPVFVTLSVRGGGGVCVKVTDADWFDVKLTWQVDAVPAPAHAPPHPEICHPFAGDAVSVTVVPFANDPLSLVPFVGIEIPVGVDVTVPDPVFVTLSVR